MIELIFLVSLREKVRRQRAEDRASALNAVRFIPVIETVEAPAITPAQPTETELHRVVGKCRGAARAAIETLTRDSLSAHVV